MRSRRVVCALVATVLAGVGVSLVMGTAAAGPASSPAEVAASVAPDNGRICRTSMLPVDLNPGNPLTPGSGPRLPLGDALRRPQVLVKLCLPKGKPTPSTVQLLVHGITYDHRYWNIADPADPQGDRYSWEAAAAKAGYATLAIDRIGAGASTHPPSTLVTIDSNATSLHDVVQALRVGRVASPGAPAAFAKVVLIGHSYGSITSFIEASRYQDVDGLILTGVSHDIRVPEAPATIEFNSYPAVLDSQFAGALLDPGYATSIPGARYREFYAPGTDVDPRIIARDEATKGTLTQSEIVNLLVILRTPLDVRSPVFLLNGSLDGLFCSQSPLDLGAPCSNSQALIANERPWFGPRVPSIDAHITPGAGHNLHAFRSSSESFTAAMTWLSSKIPAQS
ncbi:MAG: alpha/beta fold hydrolase [Pseudonocardiaceae bacterium]